MKIIKKGITLLAVIILGFGLFAAANAYAVNFADYMPLNSLTRIYVITRGSQQDLGKTYISRVTGTEVINGTLTTKVGGFRDPNENSLNLTNDGTVVKWFGNQSITLDPPLQYGILNDGDVVPLLSTNITDRCTQATSLGELDSYLADIRDINVSGITYPNAVIIFTIDLGFPAKPVNFGPNTLGFPEVYMPNSNSPLPGALTHTEIYAGGVGLIANWDIDAATGNAGELKELQSVESNPLTGTWGYGILRHKNDGTWFTESGKLTYNADGTGVNTFYYNDNGTVGSCTSPCYESFTYTTAFNSDGSISVTLTFPTFTDTHHYVLSDDGKMWIMDGTDMPDKQRFIVAVRMDTSKTYTNADVSGDYYGIGYEHNATYVAPPNGNGNYMAASSISACDGNGNYTYYGTANSDGVIWQSGSLPGETFPYSISPDGTAIFGDGISYGTGDGRIGIGTVNQIADKWGSYFSMKKGDKSYCPADLAGTWILSGFGDDNGNSFNAEFGTLTCDNSGNCTGSFKNQRDGNVTYESLPQMQFPVAVDGSFGNVLGDVSPAYAGAIGNNGNSMMFNVSFDSATTYHREMFAGVKCSNCSKIGFPQTWFEEDDPAVSCTWKTYTCTQCSGGAIKYSNQTGSKCGFSFNGKGIKWLVTKGPMMGKARVYLDGINKGLVDLYSPTNKFKQTLQATGLTPGNHTIAIEVSGQKNTNATDRIIDIDAFEVVP